MRGGVWLTGWLVVVIVVVVAAAAAAAVAVSAAAAAFAPPFSVCSIFNLLVLLLERSACCLCAYSLARSQPLARPLVALLSLSLPFDDSVVVVGSGWRRRRRRRGKRRSHCVLSQLVMFGRVVATIL